MILRTLISLVAVFAVCISAQADDVFLQAVSFALTGSDSSPSIKVINRKDCVIGIGRDVIRLNNIHVERIAIQDWVQKNSFGEQRYVTVDVRGDGPVYESYHSARLPKGDPYYSQLNLGPEMFEPGIDIKSEYRLTIYTAEKDRLVRAWSYIYQNGCTGKKSPF